LIVEIYGLYDPDTDELRYVGKANLETSKLHRDLLKKRYFRQAYELKFMMKCYAALGNSPASWAAL
jgi:hypothetical protein